MARKLLIPAVILGALIALPATATAAGPDVCVWDQNVSPAPVSCGAVYNLNRAGFSTAVTVADFVIAFAGETTLRIGPGNLGLDSTVTIAPSPGEPLHIVGAGRDQTKLQLQTSGPSLTGISLDATSEPNTSISDLTIAVPAVTAGITGASAQGGTIARTRFSVLGTDDSGHRGLATSGTSPTTVSESEFELFGGDAAGVAAIVADGGLVLSKVSVKGASPAMNGQQGVVTTGVNSNVMIDASRFENLDPALWVEKGTVKVLDSLLLNPLGDLDTAIRFASTGATDAALITSGVTVVGARTGVDISTATPSPNVDINNSIIQTAGAGSVDIACAGSPGLEPDVTVRVSILSLGAAPPSCHFTEIETINRATSPPVFVGAGDYRPALGSPQIDAGEVIYPTMMGDPSPLVDFAGATRLVDGNGDGAAKLDIGAYEYQHPVAPIAAPITGSIPPATALSLSFGKVVGKFKVKKKSPKTFTFTTAKKKPRLPVTSNLATPVELTLARSKAGYVSGRKCVKKKPTTSGKKKRCDIPLKGKLALKLPAGTTYLTFSGKWNKKKLKPAKYALTLRAPGNKAAIKSVLNVIR